MGDSGTQDGWESEGILEDLGSAAIMMGESRWRKRQGLEPDDKVFCMKGKYRDIHSALVQRGWRKNPDPFSPYFDLRWCTKTRDAYAPPGGISETRGPGYKRWSKDYLQSFQLVNHFSKGSVVVTKIGLMRTMQQLRWTQSQSANYFFPRCFDLAHPVGYARFLDDFRGQVATRVVLQVCRAVLSKAREEGRKAASSKASGGEIDALEIQAGLSDLRAGAGTVLGGRAGEGSGAAEGKPAPAPTPVEPKQASDAGSQPVIKDPTPEEAIAALCSLAERPECIAASTSLPVNKPVLDAAMCVLARMLLSPGPGHLDTWPARAEPGRHGRASRDSHGVGLPPGGLAGTGCVRRHRSVQTDHTRVESAASAAARPERRVMGSAGSLPAWKRQIRLRLGLGLQDKLQAARSSCRSMAHPSESIVSLEEWSVLRYCDPQVAGDPAVQAPSRLLAESALRRRERESEKKVAAAVRREKEAKLSRGEKVDDEDEDDEDDDEDEDDGDDSEGEASGSDDSGDVGAEGASSTPVRAGAEDPQPSKSSSSASSRTAQSRDSKSARSRRSKSRGSSKSKSKGPKAKTGKRILRQRAWEAKLAECGVDDDLLGQEAVEPHPRGIDLCGGDEEEGGAGHLQSQVGGEAGVGAGAEPWAVQPLGAGRWVLLMHLLALRWGNPHGQPHLDAVPAENVWVVKPASKSRGRGIRCMRHLPSILAGRAGVSTKASNYIVQKYIERPLLIEGYKFDIRQWVLVTSFSPLTVYFYEDCYLRFCCHKFSLEDLADRFIHLANNSVQKYADDFGDHAEDIAEGNMWHSRQFREWLRQQFGRDVWAEELQPSLKRCVVLALLASRDMGDERAQSFEMFGYDFMVSASLQPWLIEINSSPDLSYSSPTTKELVQQVSEDIVKVVVDLREAEAAGGRSKGKRKRSKSKSRSQSKDSEPASASGASLEKTGSAGGGAPLPNDGLVPAHLVDASDQGWRPEPVMDPATGSPVPTGRWTYIYRGKKVPAKPSSGLGSKVKVSGYPMRLKVG